MVERRKNCSGQSLRELSLIERIDDVRNAFASVGFQFSRMRTPFGADEIKSILDCVEHAIIGSSESYT